MRQVSTPNRDFETDYFFNSGYLKFCKKDFQGAIDDFTRALAHEGYFLKIFSLRGLAYLELGQTTYALTDFKKSIEYGIPIPKEYLRRCQ
jgi:hypothetical protein